MPQGPPACDLEKAPPEDEAMRLFALFKGGCEALGSLLQHHRAYVLSIVNEEIPKDLRRRVGASDVVQNACVSVIENISRATSGVFAVQGSDNLRSWIRSVCLHALHNSMRNEGRKVRDYRRDQGGMPDEFEQPPTPSPSSVLTAKEESERSDQTISRLQQAMQGLDEADRMLLRLRHVHDFSYVELLELIEGQSESDSDAGRKAIQRRIRNLDARLGEELGG